MVKGLLLIVAALASAPGDGRVAGDVADLSSPFEEVRTRAVERLAAAGPDADDALLAAYPGADFRTKVHLLEVFARSRRPAGLDLLWADLATPDRGVVVAQRLLVSAYVSEVRDHAALHVAPRIDGDWRAEEAIRALPGPGPGPAAALRGLLDSKDALLASAARALAERVRVVEKMREGAERIAAAGEGLESERAREIARRLFRHGVERALLAVHEAGSDGYYDGMYSLARELTRDEARGAAAMAVVVRMVKDEACPEEGLPPPRDEGYRLLEPIAPDLDMIGIRQMAAQAVGEIAEGHPEAIAELSAWMDAHIIDYESVESVDYPLALSLAGLGARGPASEIVRELDSRVSSLPRRGAGFDFEFTDYLWERFMGRLAACYDRLGLPAEAEREYRRFLNARPKGQPIARYNLACVLAKAGRTDEALRELAIAVDQGYGSDPSNLRWMERDGDLRSLRNLPEFQAILARAGR